MTVIAWDGKTLAADKQASLGNLAFTTTKIFRVNGCLVGYAGDADAGEELISWFRDGADPSTFPPSQRDREGWASLLVVHSSGSIRKYERTPFPLNFPPQVFAIGSGRDFALAAMHCGKDAVGAVEVASIFDTGCGRGVDGLRHEPWPAQG